MAMRTHNRYGIKASVTMALGMALAFAHPLFGHGAPFPEDGKLASASIVAQKGPPPSTACTGSGPSGMVFANLDELCPIVAEIGTARLESDSNGERYIAATVNNINFAVDVYNCEPNCADLSFTASFEMDGLTIDQMNEWNSTRRFGKAYIRDDGDAVIQFAINTRHGITLETFRDDLVWWESVLDDYVEFIGFR